MAQQIELEEQKLFQQIYKLIQDTLANTNLDFDKNKLEDVLRNEISKYEYLISGLLDEKKLLKILHLICSTELFKNHHNEITNRLDQMSMLYYSFKDQSLQQSYQQQIDISESKQIQKKKCIEQLKQAQNNMREAIQEMKNQSDFYIDQLTSSIETTLQNHANQGEIDPILPNIFISFSISGSLIKMLDGGYFDENNQNKNLNPREIVQIEKQTLIKDRFILPDLTKQKDIFNAWYETTSVISNSRNSSNKIIQQLLGCDRNIATNYTLSTEKQQFKGDLVGFINREPKDTMILTSSGLESYSAELNDPKQHNRLDQLNLFIKRFIPKEDDKDNTMSVNQIIKNSDLISQLGIIFHQIKKALITQFLVESSKLIFVVVRDTEQDIALFNQIKLICSNYLEKRTFYIIHHYPEIQEQYQKDQQHLWIQSTFNLKQSQNGFENGKPITFIQEEDPDQQGYRKNIPNNVTFNHLLLFGDINEGYNQQVIEILKEKYRNIKSGKIQGEKCEDCFAKFLQENMSTFFRKENDHLEFQNNQINNEQSMFKDRLMYPFNLIS